MKATEARRLSDKRVSEIDAEEILTSIKSAINGGRYCIYTQTLLPSDLEKKLIDDGYKITDEGTPTNYLIKIAW